ncbi:autophagy protein Apg12 [Histoplasma capsulatum var. duboisii H88]|uniref:Autophagy protein Apg12 n=1 Tax=Ajellomyces capsulatus (strain H88) TaxID=544711 RepID=A0A8A1LUD6_AJEC8|nr:autophagy protein Apg12 [Histoplasma capsulatum var. duboisii H88]
MAIGWRRYLNKEHATSTTTITGQQLKSPRLTLRPKYRHQQLLFNQLYKPPTNITISYGVDTTSLSITQLVQAHVSTGLKSRPRADQPTRQPIFTTQQRQWQQRRGNYAHSR